jgi:hypothetical protein
MSKEHEYDADEFDDFDIGFAQDLDRDTYDDGDGDTSRQTGYSKNAWQRLDRRWESEWLREQLSDWDDWDEYFEAH